MTNQSNPETEGKNQNQTPEQKLATQKTGTEQKKQTNNLTKEDGEREEGQNKGKTTTTPTGQATTQNPQGKASTTPTSQNQTPPAKRATKLEF